MLIRLRTTSISHKRVLVIVPLLLRVSLIQVCLCSFQKDLIGSTEVDLPQVVTSNSCFVVTNVGSSLLGFFLKRPAWLCRVGSSTSGC